MLLSLDSATSGLENFQQEINVIANNIANVNTTGFKEADVDFADTLSQTIGTSAASTSQVGTGVTTASITNNFSAGSITSTGVTSDLAINGNGFFVVKDPTSGNSYVTQDGSFTVDSSGYLVTSGGQRLQGTAGDIQISAGSSSTATVSSYSVSSTGLVTVNLSDGTSTTSQITIQDYSNPDELVKVGGNLYTATTAAGGLAAAVNPGSSGTGTLESGYLESSNVDLATQLTDLITAQRAYEANSKVVTTSDTMLQTLINMKQG
jgi:flagellar hook protein FlgE